ncbi:MAG: type II toxin-antitoxin system VapC family toxin [Ignavibacteriales bacterium]|nr:type II toxin-antitoxin system VapC family toxin [Ignavibacteriales bacterium]
MSGEYFIDTVCWIALLNQDDELHDIADREYKRLMNLGVHFVTTSAVLNKTANSLSKPQFRGAVVEFYHRLQKSSRVEILFVNQHYWSAGWKLYEERFDKSWSLTDCISFVVMQEREMKETLSNDRHFEQAGFQALLRRQ